MLFHICQCSHTFKEYTFLQEAQTYAQENSLFFMETSAKTAANVKEIFYEIGELSTYRYTLRFKFKQFFFNASNTKWCYTFFSFDWDSKKVTKSTTNRKSNRNGSTRQGHGQGSEFILLCLVICNGIHALPLKGTFWSVNIELWTCVF